MPYIALQMYGIQISVAALGLPISVPILGTLQFFLGGSKPVAALPLLGTPVYITFSALVLNLVLAAVLTPVFNALRASRGQDQTKPQDYAEEQAPSNRKKSVERCWDSSTKEPPSTWRLNSWGVRP